MYYWDQCLPNFMCSTYRVRRHRIENFIKPQGDIIWGKKCTIYVFLWKSEYLILSWHLVFLNHGYTISEDVALFQMSLSTETVSQTSNVAQVSLVQFFRFIRVILLMSQVLLIDHICLKYFEAWPFIYI